MHIPLVDIAAFRPDTPEGEKVAAEVGQALTESGFMYVRGHGIDPALVARSFATSQRFFGLPNATKQMFAYTDPAANFGFQGIEGESLDPAAVPDLKEAFTMRNVRAVGTQTQRWPDGEFRHNAVALYESGLCAAYRIMSVLAAFLGLPEDFFIGRHLGQNVTLRFLHYPAGLAARSASQLGAGAHTDYGSITLLFQDDVGGLEVLDHTGTWREAPPVQDAIVINTGDLMERWTNGRFRSTLHRVRPTVGTRDRYSIALFVDPDSDVQVECIGSCVTAERPARYPSITAGEHIQSKIAATHDQSSPRP